MFGDAKCLRPVAESEGKRSFGGKRTLPLVEESHVRMGGFLYLFFFFT